MDAFLSRQKWYVSFDRSQISVSYTVPRRKRRGVKRTHEWWMNSGEHVDASQAIYFFQKISCLRWQACVLVFNASIERLKASLIKENRYNRWQCSDREESTCQKKKKTILLPSLHFTLPVSLLVISWVCVWSYIHSRAKDSCSFSSLWSQTHHCCFEHVHSGRYWWELIRRSMVTMSITGGARSLNRSFIDQMENNNTYRSSQEMVHHNAKTPNISFHSIGNPGICESSVWIEANDYDT